MSIERVEKEPGFSLLHPNYQQRGKGDQRTTQEVDMNRELFSVLATFLFTTTLCAQVSTQPAAAPSSAAQAPTANELAPGTLLSVELSKSLDAKKLKANDKFEARTVVDLLAHGQIVIPRSAKIIGHVTEAKAHSKQSPDSMVGIAFDRVLMKDGHELPLQAAVQAIARPLQSAPSIPAEDPTAATATGMPSTSQSQRGSMSGSVATGTPYPSPSGYPPGGGAGLPSDPAAAAGSTVSPLSPASKGVVGIKGLSLDSSGPASVVSSKTDNVHLDGGTQLVLRVQ
jgi:hypothetical protein